MLDDNNIGTHGIKGENSYCGVGYVAIPKGTDREVYIKDCYRRNVITMFGGQFHPIFYDVPVTVEAIQQIKFPDVTGEYGSALLWLNVPFYNKPVVIAVVKAGGDIYLIEQENWRVTKSIDENSIDINAKASNASISFNIQASKGVAGKYKIRIVNNEETCTYDLFVKGTITQHSTKQYSIISDESFDFSVIDSENKLKGHIRYKAGEGFIYEDEFDNYIKAVDSKIEQKSKKINLINGNDQSEPAVLGNKNIDSQKAITEALSDLTNALTTFASALNNDGIDPALAAASVALNSALAPIIIKIGEANAKIQLTKSKTVNLT